MNKNKTKKIFCALTTSALLSISPLAGAESSNSTYKKMVSEIQNEVKNDTIRSKVFTILQSLKFVKGASIEKFNFNSSLKNDLGMDSLDLVEFVIKIEEEMKLTVVDSDVESVKTVQDVVNVITKTINKSKK